MVLLSRVASRLYWMARYLERAEDTARLTQAYTHLVMDIPRGADLGWDILVKILDGEPIFEKRYRAYNENNVLSFLIADEDHPGSIHQSVRFARENVRTTRDVLPEEVWEHVNELYLFTRKSAESSVGRRNRHQFLDEVQARCQAINGLIITTMCRDNAYRFISIGNRLERADMTSRIIDAGAGALLDSDRRNVTVDPLLWGSLLQSLSALSTYWRQVGPMPEAIPAVNLLLHEATFPRSLRYCLAGLRKELAQLKNHGPALRHLDRARRRLRRFDDKAASREELHEFIDKLQLDLNKLGTSINDTWFPPAES